MSIPTAMAEISDTRQQLHDAFMTMAKRSFELNQQALRNVDFYRAVLRKVAKGESIADEVPEAQGMAPDAILQVVQQLLKLNQARADQAWVLPENLQGCFVTTIRSTLPEDELITQYDVEYVGQVDAGVGRVSVNTFRRNIDVKVQASDEVVEQLWVQMSFVLMAATGE